MSALSEVVLSSQELSVTVLPGKGTDIVSVVDLRSGIDVLFRTPWAGASGVGAWDSQSRWLAAYQGGWQVLCPNAGPEREAGGARLGFHGEAALAPWTVDEVGPTMLTCSVSLFTAPLRMERTIRVQGRSVIIEESVENTSSDPCELIWTHHPAFGPPLVAADAVLELPGGTVVADPGTPDYLLAPGSEHSWPDAVTGAGEKVDLRRLPGPDQPRALLAAVKDVPAGWFAIGNERLGLGVTMWWDLAVFPHLWLWQEVHWSAGFPWHRRAYVVAAEPANVMTNQQPAGGRPVPVLAGGQKRTVTLGMTLYQPTGPVREVRPGGEVVAGPR